VGREAQDAIGASIKALQEAFEGYRDIHLLHQEDAFVAAYGSKRRVFARTEYLRVAIGELPRAVIETALVIVVVSVFALAVALGDTRDAVISSLGVFAYTGLRLQPSLQKVVLALNEIRYGAAVLHDLARDRIDLDERQAGLAAMPLQEAAQFSSCIELRRVGFSYDGNRDEALRGIDLVIPKGMFLGVCGPTGGGKSTLVDVVLGLLPPGSGEVWIDGHRLKGREAWWHRQVGVVSQRIFLADQTLRSNIALGEDPDTVDVARLDRALRRAQLLEVIASLPDGLDTVVGERGVRLSGGQRQRVAIARALYSEPPVVVLDEGTSALDAATESAFVATLADLQTDRTLIAVAHRVATVRSADRIIVVDRGSVVADGSYTALLETSELFRQLAK
jgi:ABC-type multidrug transport system fused ATPase/permease subunit